MKKKVYLLLLIILCAVIILYYNKTVTAIKVFPEPGTEQAVILDLQKAIEIFNQTVNEDMKIALTRNVNVYICPTHKNFADFLQNKFKYSPKQANQHAALYGGKSFSYMHVIALNYETARTSQVRISIASHELFHQLQAQIANNKNYKGFYWLAEGTADLMATRVSEKLGYQTIEKWKLDQINHLCNHPEHATVTEIMQLTTDERETLLKENKSPYEMSDLMVLYLVTKINGNAYQAIAEYYRLLGSDVNSDRAFELAFGININEFVLQFQTWFDGTMDGTMDAKSQPWQAGIIVQEGVSVNAAAPIKEL